MNFGEHTGRAYCRVIGADPDELVKGYPMNSPIRVEMPRWYWYRNAMSDITWSGRSGMVRAHLGREEDCPRRPNFRLV
jgi:hypothetical protein